MRLIRPNSLRTDSGHHVNQDSAPCPPRAPAECPRSSHSGHVLATFRTRKQTSPSRKGTTVLQPHQADQILGQPIHASGQVEVGTVSHVYLDDATGHPAWATVHTGVPGTKTTFVPLAEATIDGGRLTVPYDNKTISSAPRVGANDGRLALPEVVELNRHYGLRDGANQPEGAPPTNKHAIDGGARTGTAAVEMTRSEERLKVATTSRATERVRMRKHIVVEERTITVSVQREEIRLEHEPIDDDGREPEAGNASWETDGSSVEHEMVLHEEQIFVEKRMVPVERVKLVVETVTKQQQVTGQVRKEQIETNLPGH